MVTRRSILTGSAGAGVVGAALLQVGAAGAAPSVASVDARQFGVEPNLPRDQSEVLQRAITAASRSGGQLFLPAGIYVAGGLEVTAPLCLTGVAGRSRLITPDGRPVLSVRNAEDVCLSGLIFYDAGSAPRAGDAGLVEVSRCQRVVIENCQIINSAGNGLSLSQSSGKVAHNSLLQIARVGIFALDNAGLQITANCVHDCRDNGILVWQSEQRHDGSLVAHNRIARIGAMSGGSGQNGNGVNVFRAGGVIVSQNMISDCAWSAVRNNAGANVQIVNNTCARLGEVALFAEFAFRGAVISGNIVDTAGTGISITNFNDGGRLAVCANNIITNINQRPPNYSRNVGIAVEADTVVSGNVVEDTPGIAYALGWGPYARNISATGNIARQCEYGIAASVTTGAGQSLIANNIISGAALAAIVGMDHHKVVTGDLARAGDVPGALVLNGNVVS